MHKTFQTLVSFLVILSANYSLAQDAPAPAVPTAAEIKKVLDYQDNGKDVGPVLLDLVACNKVDQAKGPTQFHCIEPVSGPVKKNSVVSAWLQFFCPKDGKYEDITVQYLFDGQIRNTYDVSVASLGRTRTWKSSTLGKSGKWTIKVLRGSAELATANVTVE